MWKGSSKRIMWMVYTYNIKVFLKHLENTMKGNRINENRK